MSFRDHGFKARSWGRLETVLLIGLLVLAAGLRFYRLDSIPPGLHYDQAHDAILAWETRIGQTRPVFYTAFTGMEPLMAYSVALVMAALGHTARALHITSAVYGLLTVALTYFLARDMFGGPNTGRSRWTGLLAAGLVATSPWHLITSRNGFRAVTLPFAAALTVWALWTAFRTGRRRWYALAGAALGLTAYTYTSSRFVPIAVGLFLLLLVRDRRFLRAHLGGLALMLGVAALVFAPLGLFYAQNPDYFFVRADQTWVFSPALNKGDLWGTLRENALVVLGMFSVSGDRNWRFNIAARPVLDPLLSVLTVLGLLLFVWRAGRGDRDLAAGSPREGLPPIPGWAPYAFTLIWLAVLLLPSLLSVEGRPSSLRAVGMLPFLYLLPAVAVVTILGWVARRWAWPRPALAAGLVGLALIGGQAVATSRTYFDLWANAADTYLYFDADYVAMAHAARQELAAGRDVVLATEHYKHPSIAWEAPETLDQAHWLLGGQGVVYPAGTKDVVYLLVRDQIQPDSRLRRTLADDGATFETLAMDPAGRPAVVAARLPREQVPRLATQPGESLPQRLNLGGDLWLVDSGLPDSRKRDGRLRVEAAWAVQRATDEARTFAARLVDEQGVTWGQDDHLAYLSEQWRPGDAGWQAFELRYDPALPAGRYHIEVALTNAEHRPLPITDASGAPRGLWADLGTVELEANGGVVDAARRGQEFGPGLRLVETSLSDASVPPGGRLIVSVTWQRGEGTPADTLRLRWVDAQGATAAEQSLSVAPGYPPSRWRAGEIVRPRYALTAPSTLAPGAYRLQLSGVAGNEANLGVVNVSGPPRRFEPGPIQRPLQAQVGDVAALLGYDLAPAAPTPGAPLTVTLHWRAAGATPISYTRFVHLVDAAGVVRAQSDSPPDGGQRPTSGWVEGEVVADQATLALPADLPPGRYRLLAGLYDAATLARLAARDERGQPWPGDAVVLGEVTVGR